MSESFPPAVHQAAVRRGAAWDRAGVLVSGLCLVHCLAGLVLVGMLGLGGEVLLNPAIHRYGLVAAIANLHGFALTLEDAAPGLSVKLNCPESR